MESGQISIGKMAEMNGISIRMLRFYHEKGLLVPAIVNEETGYRYYTLDQCMELDVIQHLQSLEIPLKQIKEILEKQSTEDLYRVLEQRRAVISDQLQNLRTQMDVCNALMLDINTQRSVPICDVVMMENLPERIVVRFPHENKGVYEEPVVDPELADTELELHLRSVKQYFIARGYPLSLFRNIGCIIPLHHLARHEFSFDYSYAFVYQKKDIPTEDLTTLPAGQHVTMYTEGTHYADGSYKMTDAIEKMLAFIEANYMEPCGDYVDEVIGDTPPFVNTRSKMLVKMAIPVQKKNDPIPQS